MLLAAGLVAAACGSPRPDRRSAAPEERIAALQFRLAASPNDGDLHRQLGRLHLELDRPGAALRHLSAAGRLAGADRRALVDLLLERARRRLALGDLHAYRDLEAIARAGAAPVELDAELTRAALFAAAAAEYRRADRPGREAAAALLARAERAFGRDPRLAARDPGAAALADVAAAAAWLEDSGARRVARELYAIYRERGGAEPEHLARAAILDRWWRGAAAEPAPAATADALDRCAHAYRPADFGCAAAPTAAALDRARRHRWRLPALAAPALLAPALEAWLHGRAESWLAAVAAVTEPAGAAAIAAAPAWARPSLWRLAGDAERAAAAAAEAIESAPSLERDARAVVVAEAAIAGIELTRLEPLADSELAWLALARAARAAALAGEDGGLERALVAGAPESWRRRHFATGANLAGLAALGDPVAAYGRARLRRAAPTLAARLAPRWQGLAGPSTGLSTGPGAPASPVPPAPPGHLDPVRLAADVAVPDQATALAAIARAHGRDPALAERLARDWIDGVVAPGERAPAIVELFSRAGDPGRADRFARALLAVHPDSPEALTLAAETAAALGDEARATTLAITAAGRSGDAGRTMRRLTRSFLAAGAPRAAVEVGRWALSLTPPGNDLELLEILARALLTIDRPIDAGEVLAELESRFPDGSRQAARRHSEQLLAAGGAAVSPGIESRIVGPDNPRAASVETLARAARWNPADPEVLARLGGDWAEAQLAAIALGAATSDRAAAALDHWAAIASGRGEEALAAALRAEARGLRRGTVLSF
jgi:hypothetical protein